MTETGEIVVDPLVRAWVDRPEISARSVLVTIFGDVVRPVGDSLWLGQLITLAAPFGFNDRLVRTSLFRLAGDGWVTSERIGRRSRYELTPLARRESADADHRIYTNDDPTWDGTWTILVLDRAGVETSVVDRLITHLRWQGFFRIDRGTLIAPNVSAAEVTELLDLIDPATKAAIGEARFGDIDHVVALSTAASESTGPQIECALGAFVATYEPVHASALNAPQAYAMRVAMIHDLRRIALRTPRPPRRLLPDPWLGDRAFTVAAALYPALCERSAPWLSQVLDLPYPAEIPDRFA